MTHNEMILSHKRLALPPTTEYATMGKLPPSITESAVGVLMGRLLPSITASMSVLVLPITESAVGELTGRLLPRKLTGLRRPLKHVAVVSTGAVTC